MKKLLCFVLILGVTVVGQTPTTGIEEKVVRWSRVEEKGLKFLARDSHASTSFKSKMWVVGGHSATYYTKRLVKANARSDVWSSVDGKTWDIIVQEAPWMQRYGHSLTTYTPIGQSEMMVLMGGFSPKPSGEVWTTTDGANWDQMEQEAPWAGRGWHCAAVFNNKLWILGGSPMTSDVWWTQTLKTGDWHANGNAPWSPRAGHSCVTHSVLLNRTEALYERSLYLFGGWNDGSMNDAWKMDSAGNWVMLAEHSEWSPRAWTAVVSFSSRSHYDITLGPRLWLFGGGHVGQGTTKMVAFVDAWFSRNGTNWQQASSDSSGISTAEWTGVLVKGKAQYNGKWGHTVVVHEKTVNQIFVCNETCTLESDFSSLKGRIVPMVDPNAEKPPPAVHGAIKSGSILIPKMYYPDGCSSCDTTVYRYYKDNKVPALYFIAGDSAGLFKTKDVFQSDGGLLCERNGEICSNEGTCTLAGGCYCVPGKTGEFCDEIGERFHSADQLSCFPASSKVQLSDGSMRSISEVTIGDKVLSISKAGALEYSEVYYLPHDFSSGKRHNFLRIQYLFKPDNLTQSKEVGYLDVTGDHILYIVPDNALDLTYRYLVQAPAKSLSAGMHLLLATNSTMQSAEIISIDVVINRGLYTLYTMNGRMVVDGVLCSNFGDFYPKLHLPSLDTLPFAYFSTHRVLYRMFPDSFTSDGLRYINEHFILPILRSIFT